MNIRVLTAFFVTLSFFAADLQAQMARRIPMFEHFTQASCGPCATLNPVFEAVRENNVGAVNHVAYHTSWPGFDPMYNANPTPVNDMVGVYGVGGVPALILDGVDIGSPTAGSQAAIDASAAPGSPIRVVVSESTTGSTRDVTVSVQSAVAPPSGSFRMRAMVVEDDINYSSPPGSNGETYFPNVFREMLTGTTSGDAVTLAATGMSNDYTFSYSLDASWDASNTYVIAYVYNSSTGEILNSGSTFISPVEGVVSGTAFVEASGTNDFTANVGNFGNDDESITISVLADQPADWTLEYEILGTTYTGEATVSLPASTSEDLELRVTNGTTPGLGEYTVSVSWDANPDLAPQTLKYYVIHDVTDLVVTNEEGWGTALAFPIDEWESIYDGALNNAGRDTRAATSHVAFLKGMSDEALNGVYNIYYNVGWSFPSFTNEKVAAFESFLDRGGNLMIAGQDIAWELMDPLSSYGTPENQSFFTNYIQGTYISDGTPASTTVDFVSSDSWLGTAGASSIDAVYGASFLYPDEVNPSGPEASSIFYYNGTESKSGGIRTQTADYKLVYFGIGVEMFDDPSVQLAAVKLTHDYFWDGVSGLEFEQALSAAILGQNQPNPANTFTVIPLNELEDQALLTITDLQGKTIHSEVVNAFDNSVTINLEQFSTGIYTYFLQSGNSITPAKKLSVVK